MYLIFYKTKRKVVPEDIKHNLVDITETLKEANDVARRLSALFPDARYAIYKLKRVKVMHYARKQY